MRAALLFLAIVSASPAFASAVTPREPLPAGVPDRDTPGKPTAEGMRYDYPYILDSGGRFGLLDWCRDWGAVCGEPAAEAFCKQADGGARPNAASFAPWQGAGKYANTVLISTRQSCELWNCEAFKYIVCRR